MQTPEIIIISKRFPDFLIRVAANVASVIAIIGVGVYLQSAAMQWAGFAMLALLLILKALVAPKLRTLTIAQARARLDEIEAEPRS